MTVRASSFLELEAAVEWPALLAEYAAESGVEGMPAPTCDRAMYLALTETGRLHVFGAWVGEALVGFMFVLHAPLPHYSVMMALSESFFVAKAHRSSGAGLKLLRAAEAKTLELGAPGLVVSAPVAGRLFEVLPRCGYGEMNRTFFKAAADMGQRLAVPTMSRVAIEQVRELERQILEQPQVPFTTDHVLHGGIYTRTMFMPAGVLITGALVKVPTTWTMWGDVLIGFGDNWQRFTGYAVLPCQAHRKQAGMGLIDSWVSMSFVTDADTIEEAEAAFTDDFAVLGSRLPDAINTSLVTGG
jgi:hypothetical protein